MSTYLNDYNPVVNGEPISINRGNTYVNPVPPDQYPSWYQPEPGWCYNNGFTLGSTLSVGLEWLGFAWFRMFGMTPDGFLCSTDYIPTPWIYNPMFGRWRYAGVPGWPSQDHRRNIPA